MSRTKPQVVGKPAVFASRLVRHNLGVCAMGWVSAAVVTWFVAKPADILSRLSATADPAATSSIGELVTTTQLVAAVLAVTAVLAVRPYWVKMHKAKVGVQAEHKVARVLNNMRGLGVVMHGSLIGAGGDADHIVLGPVAALIETKYGRGQVFYKGNKLVAGHRTMPKDPVSQAARQAKALSRILSDAAAAPTVVTAVVCVSGMTNKAFRTPSGTIVCSPKDLPSALQQGPHLPLPHDAAVAAVLAAQKSVTAARPKVNA